MSEAASFDRPEVSVLKLHFGTTAGARGSMSSNS